MVHVDSVPEKRLVALLPLMALLLLSILAALLNWRSGTKIMVREVERAEARKLRFRKRESPAGTAAARSQPDGGKKDQGAPGKAPENAPEEESEEPFRRPRPGEPYLPDPVLGVQSWIDPLLQAFLATDEFLKECANANGQN